MMKRLLFCLLCACALHLTVSAHVLDQYLQVTQIALAPDGARVELRLIPGVQVAERVLALIDADSNGQLSAAEEQAYAQRVLQDLSLSINEQRVALVLADAQFPARDNLRKGLGAIRLTFTVAANLNGAAYRQLNFRNDHLPEFSSYLVNALVPESDTIKIAAQERDVMQRGVRLNFQTMNAASALGSRWRGLMLFCLCLGTGAWLLKRLVRSDWKQKAWRTALAQRLLVLLLLVVGSVSKGYAHPEPVSLIMLDVAPDKVTMDLHVPLSELALAWGKDVDVNPEAEFSRWQPQFQAYLLEHLRLVTQEQQWSVSVQETRLEQTQQMPGGPVRELVARLLLTPPEGVSARRFTLNYDAIIHQVVTHKALVSIRHDWERGQVAQEEAGVIQVNTGTGKVEPFEINLESGSWWAGFSGMVRLGAQHIKEGTDHLLFLLVLLLPATLLVNERRWGGFGGCSYSLVRLLKIVTAFTLGHSVTLLIGALGWLRLPQQPVEVLIAFSILVSAMHAIRPLFPGKEIYVASGFGLVHGLAFATVLTDLHLSAGPMALSILGFNLGIELMQLFVIAVTMPWLVLLSMTPYYVQFRVGAALLAAMAAAGWMTSRLTGETNFIDRAMQTATAYAPFGILLLVMMAVPAYLINSVRQRTEDEPDSSARELIK